MKIEIGFLGALSLIFVIAKLLGVINWSWWLVLLPVIIGVSITVIILIFILGLIILAGVFG